MFKFFLIVAIATLFFVGSVVLAQSSSSNNDADLPYVCTTLKPTQLVKLQQELNNLQYEHFLFSVSPCKKQVVRSPADTICNGGVPGYAGWTEDGPQFNSTCQYVYTQNVTTNNTMMTKYESENQAHTLIVNWNCQGIEGDLKPKETSVTSVTGNRTIRIVSISTKGCKEPDNGELKAGVIVAIVVVAIFVLVVIVAVVKAKCFSAAPSSGSGASGPHHGYTSVGAPSTSGSTAGPSTDYHAA